MVAAAKPDQQVITRGGERNIGRGYACSKLDDIRPTLPVNGVAAITAVKNEGVVAGVTINHIISRPTDEGVVTAITEEAVIACQSSDGIIASSPKQGVTSSGACNGLPQRHRHTGTIGEGNLFYGVGTTELIGDADLVPGTINTDNEIVIQRSKRQIGRGYAWSELQGVGAANIGDRVLAVAQIKNIGVIAGASLEAVVARAANVGVIGIARRQTVIG